MASTTTEVSVGLADYAATLSKRSKLLIMLGVLLGIFLEALDQTIVATALPRIVREFQGINVAAWVSTGYLLASTAFVQSMANSRMYSVGERSWFLAFWSF